MLRTAGWFVDKHQDVKEFVASLGGTRQNGRETEMEGKRRKGEKSRYLIETLPLVNPINVFLVSGHGQKKRVLTCSCSKNIFRGCCVPDKYARKAIGSPAARLW